MITGEKKGAASRRQLSRIDEERETDQKLIRVSKEHPEWFPTEPALFETKITVSLFFEMKETLLSMLQITRDEIGYEFCDDVVYKNVLGFKQGNHVHMIFRNVATNEYVWAIVDKIEKNEDDFLMWFEYVYPTFESMLESMVEIYLYIQQN
jgi:hypothetical protein